MHGLLVYAAEDIPRNEWFIGELCKCAESEGISLRLFVAEEGTAALAAAEPDFVLNRSRSKKIAEFCEETLGISVYNSAEVTAVTNDKWLTHGFLRAHGIQTADTVLVADRTPDMLPEPPLVAKPPDGHGGAGVEWLADAEALERALREKRRPFLLQQPMLPGWDVRLYMLGGEVYAAMLRTADGLRSNFSLGGRAERITPDEGMLAIAEAVQQVLPLDFAGIDLLRYPAGGYVVGEIEDAVGCRMLYQSGGFDPARDYIRMITKKEREKR